MNLIDYPWSSYNDLYNGISKRIILSNTLDWFESREEFEDFHKEGKKLNNIDSFILE